MTGRYEPEKPKPWEGMTEEQKEYEAMKLVETMDKLNRLIQPLSFTLNICILTNFLHSTYKHYHA